MNTTMTMTDPATTPTLEEIEAAVCNDEIARAAVALKQLKQADLKRAGQVARDLMKLCAEAMVPPVRGDRFGPALDGYARVGDLDGVASELDDVATALFDASRTLNQCDGEIAALVRMAARSVQRGMAELVRLGAQGRGFDGDEGGE